MQMYSSNKYKTIPNPCRLLPNSLHHHCLPQHLLGWAASLLEHDQGAQTRIPVPSVKTSIIVVKALIERV